MSVFFNCRGEGRPLVLLHGWGFDHRIWKQLAVRLEPFYQLFLVDLPGFGQSPILSWDEFKEKLLQALPAEFAIMGWSMGGLYATRLAIEEPSRVSHLINVASSPRFIRETDWPGLDPMVFKGFMDKLSINPGKTLIEFVGLQSANQPPDYLDSLQPSLQSLQHGLSVLAEWDLRQAMERFNGRAAYLFGGLDSITSRHTLRAMQKKHPHFYFALFPKAAHMPFLSHEDEFIQELKVILDS